MAAHKKKTILITNQTDPVLEFGRNVFLRQGCNVLTAATGAEVVQLCKRQTPDLAVIDLGITEPAGLTVLRSLQADPETAHLPVVVIADTSPADTARHFQGKGVMDYLAKPVRLVELTRRTAELLAIPFRCPLRIPVQVSRGREPSAGASTAEVYDISINGMRIVGQLDLSMGATLHLNFRLPDRPADSEAVALVMRTAPLGAEHEYGLEFIETPDEVLDLIEEYSTEMPPSV